MILSSTDFVFEGNCLHGTLRYVLFLTVMLVGSFLSDGFAQQLEVISNVKYNPANYVKTVRDYRTGLEWQHETTVGMEWEEAREYCQNLEISKKNDWHLPTIYELFTLVDYSVESPAIRHPFAQTTLSEGYWTSTRLLGATDYYWYLNFNLGVIHFGGTEMNTLSVRCARKFRNTLSSSNVFNSSINNMSNAGGEIENRNTAVIQKSRKKSTSFDEFSF